MTADVYVGFNKLLKISARFVTILCCPSLVYVFIKFSFMVLIVLLVMLVPWPGDDSCDVYIGFNKLFNISLAILVTSLCCSSLVYVFT